MRQIGINIIFIDAGCWYAYTVTFLRWNTTSILHHPVSIVTCSKTVILYVLSLTFSPTRWHWQLVVTSLQMQLANNRIQWQKKELNYSIPFNSKANLKKLKKFLSMGSQRKRKIAKIERGSITQTSPETTFCSLAGSLNNSTRRIS